MFGVTFVSATVEISTVKIPSAPVNARMSVLITQPVPGVAYFKWSKPYDDHKVKKYIVRIIDSQDNVIVEVLRKCNEITL